MFSNPLTTKHSRYFFSSVLPKALLRLQLFYCKQQLMQCIAVKIEKFQLIATHCISAFGSKIALV